MRKSSWQTFFFLVATIVAVIPSFVFSAEPPTPKWTSEGCGNVYSFCSNVTTMESWSSGDKNIYFFLNVFAKGNSFDDTNLTVWYVGENFDDFWAKDLRKQTNANVVRFYPRGGDLAYPQITCDKQYYDTKRHCTPSVSCAEQIAKTGINLKHYSIAETAADLAWVVRKFSGKNMLNVIVAEGFGSFVVQEMLQTQGKIDNLWVIMAGFAHPQYFNTFLSFNGYDSAMQHILTFCEREASLECLSRIGATEGTWDRLFNVLAAAEANTLKCNKKLSWGVKAEDMHHEYRAVLAKMLKHPENILLSAKRELLELIPSFLYRLQRCNDGDISSLNRLYSYVKESPDDKCPTFIPQRYNWLVNDLVSSNPPNREQFMRDAYNLHLVMPNYTTLQEFYDFYEALPKYNVSSRSISSTDTPMMLLLSDVDPIFSWGASSMAAVVYKSSEKRFLPFQTGLPVSTSASECIMNNIGSIYKGHGWLDAAHCTYKSNYDPDLIDVDATSFYGRRDAWEFTVPNSPEFVPSGITPTNPPGPTPTPSPHPSGECSNKGVVVLAVLFVITLIALVVVFVLQWRKTAYSRVSDDFYSNLHH